MTVHELTFLVMAMWRGGGVYMLTSSENKIINSKVGATALVLLEKTCTRKSWMSSAPTGPFNNYSLL